MIGQERQLSAVQFCKGMQALCCRHVTDGGCPKLIVYHAERPRQEPLRIPEPLQQRPGVHAACGAAPQHSAVVLGESKI